MGQQVTDWLHEQTHSIWQAAHQHPFVRELGDGTLDVDKFRFYILQDYVYLIDYSKLFAWAAIKAPKLEWASRFAGLLESTLNREMDLHRGYAAQFGISPEELEATEPAPVTVAYTKYVLDAAAHGDLEELLAALLPCAWLYWEVGCGLAKSNRLAPDSLYRAWIEQYADPRFGELTAWLRACLDELAADAPDWRRQRLYDRFITASRFEYMFWDAAYHRSGWPVS
ncbi:thiaminase II [Alicyclobacillus shizuokensis]|uniref:thiaminase II n=1 Tax=Alicyclobacillus shizuokensis TaxID=392014 RepID=UPI00082E11CC|nr:thiaminase II [Alicyclobacillus shizuokensis]MCL6626204.1 thiaminase II [Alicyclobacillus shizuokensis]